MAVKQFKEKDVYAQYPDGTAHRSCVFIPLHPAGIHRKSVAEVQPRPGKLPVQVDKFKGNPEKDKQKIPLVPAVNVPARYVIDVHDNGHKHGVQQPGKGCGGCGEPDPVSGGKVPDKKSRIGIKEHTELAEFRPVLRDVLFDEQQRDKSGKKKSREAVHGPSDS